MTSNCWVRVAHLDDLASAATDYASLLCEEERRRQARLATDFLRRRFALSHGLLRETLGRFLGQPAEALPIRRGKNGRPELVPAGQTGFSGPDSVDFNLSYSGPLVACAVVRGRRIGVDIEQVSPRIHTPGLERMVMSPEERAWLGAMDSSDRNRAFFSIWVLKEAWAKARGEGLGLPFGEVTLRPGAHTPVMDLSAANDDGARWCFFRGRVNGEAELALALEAKSGPTPDIHWLTVGSLELRDAGSGRLLGDGAGLSGMKPGAGIGG